MNIVPLFFRFQQFLYFMLQKFIPSNFKRFAHVFYMTNFAYIAYMLAGMYLFSAHSFSPSIQCTIPSATLGQAWMNGKL